MTEKNSSQRQFRFRLYFWLMDICLIFAGIGLADYTLDKVFGIAFDHDSRLYFLTGMVVIFFNFLVPPFLIVARFMRDEYAELLWRQTAVVFIYILAITPLFLFAAAWIDYWTSATGKPHPFLAFFAEGGADGGDVIIKTWMAFMLLFVGIFQFLRWRDSR